MTDRWATFDCYGTLIDWQGGITRAFEQLWPDVDPRRLLEAFHALEPVIQADSALPYREVLTRALRSVAAAFDLPLQAIDADALPRSLPEWRTFPEVPNALKQLKADGWRLAILSNTDPDLLQASIKRIDVAIELAITAAEAGSYKPAHGHWNRFFERSNASKDTHVHVAASLFHDIAPASELGLKAVWINRLQESSPMPRAAELPDLTNLPATLDSLVPRSTESQRGNRLN
jgi:2-haloacid dehalogenase